MKRILKFTFAILSILVLMFSTSAATTPTATFTLVQGLPAVMNVGDTATVVVQVDSDQPFNFAMALPDEYYPGRGVVAVKGGDRVGKGTTATLAVTFKAKGSTADFADGVAVVHVTVGARYGNDGTLSQDFVFTVRVP